MFIVMHEKLMHEKLYSVKQNALKNITENKYKL